MMIRIENTSDVEAIFDITKAAFENHPFSQNTEQFIINALRRDNALTLSLVADLEGKVVGHIAFSPVSISDENEDWYALGPVSVKPEFQKQGIGKALIHEGLSRLKTSGAQGCVLVGDPAYYSRFGFKSFPDLNMEGVPQEYVLALPLGEKNAKGTIRHHHAFSAKE